MGALSANLKSHQRIGDKVIRSIRSTSGPTPNASDEWVPTRLANVEAIIGFAVIGTASPFVTGAPVAAHAHVVMTDNPSASDTLNVNGTVYTFVATLAAANDVLIGTGEEDTAANLVAAINGAAGEGTTYGTGTVAHTSVTASTAGVGPSTVTFTAIVPGTAGNAFTLDAGSMTNGTASGATFSGGLAASNEQRATATVTFGMTATDTDGVVINGITYTFAATVNAAYLVENGASAAASAANLAAAINDDGTGDGSDYGAGTLANPFVTASVDGAVITLTARVPGTGGNAITVTTDDANVTLSAGTLEGGAAASSFGQAAKVNAQGTADTEGNAPGDVAVEFPAASVVFELTVIGTE